MNKFTESDADYLVMINVKFRNAESEKLFGNTFYVATQDSEQVPGYFNLSKFPGDDGDVEEFYISRDEILSFRLTTYEDFYDCR